MDRNGFRKFLGVLFQCPPVTIKRRYESQQCGPQSVPETAFVIEGKRQKGLTRRFVVACRRHGFKGRYSFG